MSDAADASRTAEESSKPVLNSGVVVPADSGEGGGKPGDMSSGCLFACVAEVLAGLMPAIVPYCLSMYCYICKQHFDRVLALITNMSAAASCST